MSHPGSEFMSNKKIANVLKEAIDSPLGSTKRKAAKNLIAVMRRTTGQGGPGYGYFGQGGPGGSRYSPSTPGSSSFVTKAPRKDPDYSNMIIFPSPPAPKRGNPLTKSMIPPAQDTSKGVDLGTQDSLLASDSPQQIQNTIPQSNFKALQMVPLPGTSTGKGGPGYHGQGGFGDLSALSAAGLQPSTSYNFGSLGSYTLPKTETATSPSSLISGGGSAISSAYPNLFSTTKQDLSKLTLPTGISGTGSVAPAPAPLNTSGIQLGNQAPKWDPVKGTFTFGDQPAAVAPTAPTETTTPTTPTTTEAPATITPTTETTTTTQETVPAPVTGLPLSDLASSISAGLKNTMGATAWAQQTMANPELLRGIFPGMDIPADGSLSTAVKKLQKTLQDQYNIKELQSQLLQMTANGVTLGPMLQTYIQNKDRSLGEIHDQIQEANDIMLHSDAGDPYESTIWSRYNDYLNNLYTAQNASYADFFNKSTTLYSNALNALNTTLSNSLTQYNNELTLDTALTEADFNRMYQGLTDMYTAAQNAPFQEIQLATLKSQLALANASLITAGSTAGQGDWVAEYKKLTDMGVLFDNATGDGGTSNARYGTLMEDVTDIGGMIQTIVSDEPKIGVDGALYIVGQAFQKTLQSLGSDPAALMKTSNKFQQMIISAVSDGYIPAAMGLQMAQQLAPSVVNSISSYFASNPNASETARNAMVDALVGSGWLGKKVPSLADFRKRYSTDLTLELSDAIYQQMNDAKSIINTAHTQTGGTGPAGTSPYAGKTVEQIYQELADEIKALATPQDIGNYVGNLVAPVIVGKAIQALQPVGT